MPHFEYHVLETNNILEIPEMNRLGNERWELVSLVARQRNSGGLSYVYVFKKEKLK